MMHTNEKLMKALKAVNFISGKSMTESELIKHRKLVEWVGRMAAPKGDVRIKSFMLGEMPCEAIKPDYAHNPEYCVLYAHGGGYIAGGLDYSRMLGVKMAIATGFTTYSFAYRLEPEHQYPSALEDGLKIWDYLVNEKYSPDHIILAGDSAGGNLALCLVQRLMSEGKPLPKALILFSPWTDMTETSETYEINKDIDPILSRDYVLNAAVAYTGCKEDGDIILSDPRFSPLNGNLKGLPPVYIMAGRNGILLNDSIRLKEKLTEAGVKVKLDIEEKGWHVYPQMPIPMATRAMKRLAKHVSEIIYGNK